MARLNIKFVKKHYRKNEPLFYLVIYEKKGNLVIKKYYDYDDLPKCVKDFINTHDEGIFNKIGDTEIFIVK